MNPTIHDFGSATMASLASAMALFFAAIPKIVGFLVILLVGWLIASLVAKGVAALLRAVKFNEMSQNSGFTGFVHNMGIQSDAAGFIAGVTKWFIRLIALVVAFDALGLPAVSEVLRQLLLWLPNLVVAMVVLVIAGLIANAVSRLVRGASAEAGFSRPELLSKIAAGAVWAFGVVVAVNQVGIATELVNTLFMAVVGATALALGLSFGLGGRDTAAEIVRRWYGAGQEAAPKIDAAAEAASRRAGAMGMNEPGNVPAGEPRPTRGVGMGGNLQPQPRAPHRDGGRV